MLRVQAARALPRRLQSDPPDRGGRVRASQTWSH